MIKTPLIFRRGPTKLQPIAFTGLISLLTTARQYTAASSQYHSKADNAFHSPGDIDLVGGAFVYADTLGAANKGIMSKDGAAGQRGFGLRYLTSSNRLEILVSDDGTAINILSGDELSVPSTGTWYFLLWWHDATANTSNLKINDGTTDSVAHTGGVFDSSGAFVVGARLGGTAHFWDGRIGRSLFAKSTTARVIIDDISGYSTWFYNGGVGRVGSEVAGHATLGPLLDGVLMDYYTGDEASGNLLSYSGLNDLTDNNSVTSAAGPGQ